MFNDDQIEKISSLAAKVGFNKIRVAWKLRAFAMRRQRLAERSELTGDQRRYPHVHCPSCHSLQTAGTARCDRCNASLRFAKSRRALAQLSLPTMTTALVALILMAFLRVYISEPGFNFSGYTLAEFGANYGPLVLAGQWWRLISAQFLHAGVMHLAFNLFAISVIGPRIEEIFGRRLTFFIFIVAGASGFFAGTFFNSSISIGASGAIMGLAGAAAGFGTRDGTAGGKELRSTMFGWLIASTIIGLMMPIDHASHFGGFGVGFLLGYSIQPRFNKRRPPVDTLLASLAFLAFAFGYLALMMRSFGTLGG